MMVFTARRALLLAGLALAAAACGRARAAGSAADPTGLWWADHGAAQVEISEANGELRGRIVWLRNPYDDDGCPLADRENPDTALRSREVLGMELLRGLRHATDVGSWTGGELYDPDSGRTYRCSLRAKGPDELELRGYLGIELLGRSVRWFRVGREPQCRAPSSP